MADSVKATPRGLERIDQARRSKGWNKTAEAWCSQAFTSRATLNRFWARHAIRRETFITICEAVGIDWEEVVEGQEPLDPPPRPAAYQDWGQAPDVSGFCGREPELNTLQQWTIAERCRLVSLIGMGGIGKTTLAIKWAQQQNQFQFTFWRSLRNAPRLEDLLTELIEFLSHGKETDLPEHLDGKMLRLLHYLRTASCLLILDNVESILQSGQAPSASNASRRAYREGYERYGQMIRCLGESPHQSTLIVTSREPLPGLAALEGQDFPGRCLQLQGLPPVEGRAVLCAQGTLTAPEEDWQALITRYGGNPLALKIISAYIRDFFDGNVAPFLELLRQEPFIFDDIRDLLTQQFGRLSPLEQQLIYWLAINREPVAYQELRSDFLQPVSGGEIVQGLMSVQRRSLVEKTDTGFTLQPVVMEYALAQLIEQVAVELTSGHLKLLHSHALSKAQAKDYIRTAQGYLILQPLIDRLKETYGSIPAIAAQCREILDRLRGQLPRESGYAGGNIFNLLRQMQVELDGYDFSRLVLWQANFQGLALHHVNLAAADLSKAAFTQTFGSVLTVAFSPDGNLLATGDGKGDVQLWQVASAQPLLTLPGHANWVQSVVFSPDGTLLASGSDDKTIRLWEVPRGQLRQTLRGHTNSVRAIAFSPNGKLLASGSTDGTLRLWEVASGQLVKMFSGHRSSVWSVDYSPNGKLLASGSSDGTVKLWEVKSGRRIRTLQEHTSWVWSVAFSPDGTCLASGSDDNTIKLWSIRSGQALKTLAGHTQAVRSVVFHPDGKTLASGSDDRTIRLWNLIGQSKSFLGHSNSVWSVVFHPNGQTLASGSTDQTVRLWETATGQAVRSLQGHTNWVLSVAFSPDGQILASGSDDSTIKLWDISDRTSRILSGHTNWVWSVAFSPNGHLLASASDDRTIRLWHVPTGQALSTLVGHTDWVLSVAFSPNGRRLASASADRTIRLWDSTGQLQQTLSGHSDWVRCVTFSPDGHRLASASTDGTIRLWDADTGRTANILQGHRNWVRCVTFSPNGHLLASASTDGTIILWNAHSGQMLQTLRGHTDWVLCVAFSPDGCTLASGSTDRTIKLWNLVTQKCDHTLRGHAHSVQSVAYSKKGYLASCSKDETIKLWRNSQCWQTLKGNQPYQGTNITGVTGLSEAQLANLQALGAILE
ncbi:MAG: NB-ARC domain-containing protein [Cyanophyceae cyanobacterium]